MIEEFIQGREITVGIVNGKTLPIMEIVPKVDFYNYHAKYIDDNTEYLFDTITGQRLIDKISHDAIECYNSLNCRGVARVDFLLTDNNVPYALEINTIPGMTTHSCVPKAAEKIGISMTDLCGKIIDRAIKDFKQNYPPNTINSVDGQKKEENKTQSLRQA
jgi:D-alanine-D-alanine ligase